MVRKQLVVPDNLKRSWVWLLILGIIFVILGVIGLGMTIYLTLVSMLFFGILLVVGGVLQLFDSIRCRGWKGIMGHLLVGLLYIVGGGIVIYDPFLASAFFTMIIGAILIVMGLTRFIMAMTLKASAGWGWMVLSGLCGIILGTLILMQWPMSGLWIIGLFFAIELMIAGWSYIFCALSMRRHHH